MKTLSKNKTQANGFTEEERAAMKEHIQDLRAAERGLDGEKAVLGKIAQMPEPDRGMAKRLHEIIKAHAPILTPRLWYGMPAYANKQGKVVCFFQGAHKFKARYATIGFSDSASLDEGNIWPTAFAIKSISASEESIISKLIQNAVK